ncbi:MAG: hypothetical protein BWX89_01269 [candidate division TA06 bacterium ADurb.Bin131]|uniref:Uncharacterized protein n=1 Tax=candidate division TA06 bacterium ADurb.Bin131 TaxID=1852827 RepID=A0A1V6C6X1_UNCT6|nr:MAG: hypothetical protein BWX89_01269 [candidate division TA06 bacterium ADurb.Bin131]
MIPKQFGPIILQPYFFEMLTRSFSLFSPSGPLSLNPALITTAAFVCFFPHSSITEPTSFAGTTTTARSGTSGILDTSG